MTTEQYNNYKKIALKICKGDERTQDLLHDVLLQLDSNTKYNLLDEKGRLYFFVRAISNQYNSNNSSFYRQYRRMNFGEINNIQDTISEQYVDTPDYQWIKETLNNETKNNPDFWYEEGIFNLYLEHKKIQTLHQRTRIPKYSLRKTINEIKLFLKTKWKQQND
jgi:hypothetical protein